MKKADYAHHRKEDKKRESKAKVKVKEFARKDKDRDKKRSPHKQRALDGMFSAEEFTPEVDSGSTKGSTAAFKLLAAQENVSNNKAKELIDKGRVYVGNRKVMIARGLLRNDTEFNVQALEKIAVIFEDENFLVVDKPAFYNTEDIEKKFPDAVLLHRLDRETSGVLMLTKSEDFRAKAINEFIADKVYKEYTAWIEGVFIEDVVIDKPIVTQKIRNRAISKCNKNGKPAITEVYTLEVNGKKSKVKCVIHHGRTHQIRVHLNSIGFPIVGDTLYGGRDDKRVMLHAKKVKILGYTFTSKEPKVFAHLSS